MKSMPVPAASEIRFPLVTRATLIHVAWKIEKTHGHSLLELGDKGCDQLHWFGALYFVGNFS